MAVDILLVTPPFTQLNTPYPATAYLQGFLKQKGYTCSQADLGLDLILAIFSRSGLSQVFNDLETRKPSVSPGLQRMISLKKDYLYWIEPVVRFLQGKDAMLAYRLSNPDTLPHGPRLENKPDLEFLFGTMGIQDQAKLLSTYFLEDLGDLIREGLDPHFGFSRYAEQLGRSAYHFDDLAAHLYQTPGLIEQMMFGLLDQYLDTYQPRLVGFSVPFPGNLTAAFRCAQRIKNQYPGIKTILGGGFVNTELRSLQETRVGDYFDFITLDDGEAPLEHVLEYLDGKRDALMLKRCFLPHHGTVTYINGSLQRDYRFEELVAPDYEGLPLDKYLQVLDLVNPMHRLWNDGRWNKLTMAHGCYWGKCTFCDIHLDYIERYEPLQAAALCDRVEVLIRQTGVSGFHFVDEAAPPALMREFALELLRRKLVISWWTNIRFEKAFSHDLCRLLKASGCIGVSGGLEVASDRLLDLIKKGVSVLQVARVMQHFKDAGIMVHAYLMYGYPTQTAQETIDSLEIVRQFFELDILKSAYWHRFALTVHSPIARDPELYGIKIDPDSKGPFANNDLVYDEPGAVDLEMFGPGLQKSLYNYMQGIGIQEPLQNWFQQKIPASSLKPDFIKQALEQDALVLPSKHSRLIWLGRLPEVSWQKKSKKGITWNVAQLIFSTPQTDIQMNLPELQAQTLLSLLNRLENGDEIRLGTWIQEFEQETDSDFELQWFKNPLNKLVQCGLLVI